MYKQCTSEQSAARQREMEQGLLEMMLKKRFDEFTVSDLCVQLNIPRKAFYRYFSGKEGALYSLIDHVMMDCDYHTVRELQKRSPMQYFERICGYWITQKPLLDALAKSGMSGILIQRAVEYSRRIDAVPHFLTTADRQLQDYGSAFAVCGIMTMMVQWHHDGYAQSVEQMARLMVRLLIQPMFTIKE